MGGFLGWVLRPVQQRKSPPEEFRPLLARVVGQLESMPPAERLRWLELVSYVMALVYHERGPTEGPLLRDTIESSVRTDRLRQEVSQMGKTHAEELMEKGKLEAESSARQHSLIRLLGKRFGELPNNVSAAINATDDVRRLDDWMDQVIVAECLEDFEFES